MIEHFLNDSDLRGPLGTRRQPQVWDFIPHIRMQKEPVWKLPEDGTRWFTSPYLWQQHQNGIENFEAQRNLLGQAQMDEMLRMGARQFDVQEQLLRRMLEEHVNLAQQLAANQIGRRRGFLGDAVQAVFGPGGGPPPDGGGAPPRLNEAQLIMALRPLFENQAAGLREAIAAAIEEGRGPPPVVDGRQIARALEPVFGQQTQAITDAIARAPRVTDLPAASSASDRPPPPPPPPALPPPVQAALLSLPPYMRAANEALATIAQQNDQVIQQLAGQAAAQQVGTAIAMVDDRDRVNAIGDQLGQRMTQAWDQMLAQIPAIVLAHQVAPNPQLADLERRFAGLHRTLENQLMEIQRMRAGAHQNPQIEDQSRAIAVLQQEAEETRGRLENVADGISRLLERLARPDRDVMRAIEDQAVENAAAQQMLMAATAMQALPAPEEPLALMDQIPTLVVPPGSPSPRQRMQSRRPSRNVGLEPTADPAAAMAIGASSSSSSSDIPALTPPRATGGGVGEAEARELLRRGPLADLLAQVLGPPSKDNANTRAARQLIRDFPVESYRAFSAAINQQGSVPYSDEYLLKQANLDNIAELTKSNLAALVENNPTDRRRTIELLATMVRAYHLRPQPEGWLTRGVRRVARAVGLGDTPPASPARNV